MERSTRTGAADVSTSTPRYRSHMIRLYVGQWKDTPAL